MPGRGSTILRKLAGNSRTVERDPEKRIKTETSQRRVQTAPTHRREQAESRQRAWEPQQKPPPKRGGTQQSRMYPGAKAGRTPMLKHNTPEHRERLEKYKRRTR